MCTPRTHLCAGNTFNKIRAKRKSTTSRLRSDRRNAQDHTKRKIAQQASMCCSDVNRINLGYGPTTSLSTHIVASMFIQLTLPAKNR